MRSSRPASATKLTLLQSHDRPISDDILSGGRAGWPAILSSLKSLLETGEAMAIPMQPPQRMLAALKELGIATAVGPTTIVVPAPVRNAHQAGNHDHTVGLHTGQLTAV